MAGENRHFQYQPLRPDCDEIRLLVLHPANDVTEPLRCDLQVASLRCSPRYEALSYVWGSPGKRGTIQVSGHEFSTFENLDAALRRLRSNDKVRVLWIDAVCVNQSDNHEKGFQIPLMRRIYAEAEQVCIWLGEATEFSVVGMQALKAEFLTLKKHLTTWRLSRRHGYLLPHLKEQFSSSMNFKSAGDLNTEFYMGEVRELLSRPWWTRVWIMQEAIVAKKLVLMCGEETAPWVDVEKYVKEIKWTQIKTMRVFGIPLNPDFTLLDEGYSLLSQLRRRWQEGSWEFSIYDLLYNFRRLNCTDPKDRIYGFLGLAEKSLGFSIYPDYESPVHDVFVNVARILLQQTNTLDILNCKREWRGVSRIETSTYAYSLFDQAKYHDIRCQVQDMPGKAARLAWVQLPPGWERIHRGGRCYFYDWKSHTYQDHSPLQQLGPQRPAVASRQKILPEGWQKTWNDLGVPVVKYCAPELRSCDIPGNTIRDERSPLPSWVPNWDAHTHWDAEPLLDWSKSSLRYWAGGIIDRPLPHSTSSQQLCLEGVCFDTIVRLSDAWHPTSSVPPVSRQRIDVLKSWERIAMSVTSNCPYGGVEGRRAATWRSHIADYAGNHAAPIEDEPFIQCWYDNIGWAKDIPEPDQFAGKGFWDSTMLATDCQDMENAMYLHLMDISPFSLNPFKGFFSASKKYGNYAKRIHKVCAHRALFVTQRGYIGLAPWNSKLGDMVFVLKGGKTPFILRREIAIDGFSLVGESYVYGIMGGEALHMGLPVREVNIH